MICDEFRLEDNLFVYKGIKLMNRKEILVREVGWNIVEFYVWVKNLSYVGRKGRMLN